jgi:hypothetical protein
MRSSYDSHSPIAADPCLFRDGADRAAGPLGALADTVGRYGAGSLQQVGALVILFYVSVTFFVLVVFGLGRRATDPLAHGILKVRLPQASSGPGSVTYPDLCTTRYVNAADDRASEVALVVAHAEFRESPRLSCYMETILSA